MNLKGEGEVKILNNFRTDSKSEHAAILPRRKAGAPSKRKLPLTNPTSHWMPHLHLCPAYCKFLFHYTLRLLCRHLWSEGSAVDGRGWGLLAALSHDSFKLPRNGGELQSRMLLGCSAIKNKVPQQRLQVSLSRTTLGHPTWPTLGQSLGSVLSWMGSETEHRP